MHTQSKFTKKILLKTAVYELFKSSNNNQLKHTVKRDIGSKVGKNHMTESKSEAHGVSYYLTSATCCAKQPVFHQSGSISFAGLAKSYNCFH